MPKPSQSRINDLVIKIANVNGTGSASANGLLMRTLFRMGIPVMGKNYFPSNIQGLPTWYEIRVSKNGYVSRSGRVDVMVAMNAETYDGDLGEVSPGGYLVYDSTWPRNKSLYRDDITVIGVPLSKMCNETFEGARARILMKNVAYVGALAALLNIDLEVIKELLLEMFAAKEALVASNLQAIHLGYDYAVEHCDCPLNVTVEAMNATDDYIMIDGNTAAALGCVYAGATVGAWYPITPSTSVMDSFKMFCEAFRVDKKTGERRYCIVQAEDELAAVGMVLGASWCGARAFTPTSGPGISLMSEFIGFGYFTEIPAVIFDVQRVGPSTGMPTRTQQCDLMTCAYASHGDTKHILLFPANPEECFHFAVKAFDLADRFQTPVIVLTDLDIGMNDWMCPRLSWDDDYTPDRGKVLSAGELEEAGAFHRYLDTDGDGIAARTLPGVHEKGAYFLRGSGHNKYGQYTEDADEYQEVTDRLKRKVDSAAEYVPEPVVRRAEHAELGIVSIGSCDGAVSEAIDQLRDEGVFVDYLRVRGFPFGDAVRDFLDTHAKVFVVEQNRDGQLRSLLRLELGASEENLLSIRHYSGLPIDSGSIQTAIQRHLEKGAAA